ncbi:MAG: SGNH/GDSL hydrolase family protein [Armatimonadetes bacterium]|nr:SGNH/GDSL hydrolase family protein [Armatimonadota bacterium]
MPREMPAFRQFIALGDSMLSDDFPGQGRGAASLLYRNPDPLYAEFAGKDLSTACRGVQFLPLARTGLTTRDLLESSLSQLRPSRDPTLVVLSGGGNDLLECLLGKVTPEEAIEGAERNLKRIVGELERRYLRLTLRIANVYDPTDGTGGVQSGHQRLAQAGRVLGVLNLRIADLAGDRLIDCFHHFRGHGARHADPSYEHYCLDDPSGWIMFDIEPNPRGASEIRRLVWRSLV